MVWESREAKRNPESCLYKAIISGNGTFEIAPHTGHLIDNEKQLQQQVLSTATAEKFCTNLKGFVIYGLPNAILVTDHLEKLHNEQFAAFIAKSRNFQTKDMKK